MQVNDYLKLTGIAVGLSAGLFVSYKVYKRVSGKIGENKELKDYKKDIDKNKLSLSNSDYQTMADAIYTALNQSMNDDEAAVYNVLRQLKSKDDWLALVRAFGIRKRDYDWFTDKQRLPAYIGTGLEWWEMKKVREILAKIGVAV